MDVLIKVTSDYTNSANLSLLYLLQAFC